MVDLTSAPVLGFLGGILGGTVAQGLAFLRRRKRDLDRLRSVLKEIRELSETDLDSASTNRTSGITDDEILFLQNELRQTRLQASYLLDESQSDRISKLQNQFSFISNSAGNHPTNLDNSQLAERFTEHSDNALDSLKWGTIRFHWW